MKTPEELKEYKRQYYLNNQEKIKKYLELKKDELIEKRKENYNINSEELKQKRREYYKNNKEKSLKISKDYQTKNRDNFLKKKKEYRENNKNDISEKKKIWDKENREKINNYTKEKRKTDPVFKLADSIRSSISSCFRRNNYKKKSRTTEILGCAFIELKAHLESKFEPWMTWENRGLYNGELNYGWDMDHIIPIASAITEEDIIKLNHYTNFQPLCSYTNRHIKRDNY